MKKCSNQHVLHSFPTRRSSDLQEDNESNESFLQRINASLEFIPAKAMLVSHSEDRKSTRLNSSHRCISYAVFCLKKKNEVEDVIWQEVTVEEGSGTIQMFLRWQ